MQISPARCGVFAFAIVMALMFSTVAQQSGSEERWWPAQAVPRAIVRSVSQQEFPNPRLACQMMVQSVAGLAAKAVNEGRGDELVWVDNGNADLDDWLARWLAKHPEAQTNAGPALGPWELVDRFAKRGVVKGYILYRLDKSEGDFNASRPGIDVSVNVATTLAGLFDAIMVDEELESSAVAHGLKKLMDACGKTTAWCFEIYGSQLNRRMLFAQDPRKPHARDLAVAHKALTLFGNDAPAPAVMAWLEPLSPILGWGGGDEFVTTDLSSRWGHIQTATDWCMNLPVLMAGSEQMKTVAPRKAPPIDWSDRRSGISFVMTDGDNVQWLQGNFFRHPDYWADKDRGKIPFGWSCCFAHLAQLCPSAIDYMESSRTGNDSLIEWGGGYYYPDRFGMDRTNRWELLARHARRTWALMNKTDTRIIGFNVQRLDSPDALRAYEVIAGQMDGLLGIFAFQYDPYEGGAGKVFWVKDRNGIEIPVVTARYSIWEHANARPRAGTPAKIAREIRESVEQNPKGGKPRYDWAINHAWSYFRKAPGTDEAAENLLPTATKGTSEQNNAARGYTPAVWCAERLPASIRVVSPEELVWRIRMQHDPTQTRRAMEQAGR